MEIRLLGPLEVSSDGRTVELGGGRHRALLAMLALHANEVVSTDRLIDDLWAERAPPTAPKVLQNLVSRLRKMIDPDESGVLRTQPPGYVLKIADEAIDVRRFERLASEGRRALETDPKLAADRLRSSLLLWRGEALAEFAYEPFAQAEIARLEELRLTALEDRVEADLELGRHAEVAPELQALVAANPMRERLCAQLMLALYRTGRQAEALEVYRQWRRSLNDEMGLEPSAELRRLEQAILTQDPSLGPAPRRLRPPFGRNRRVGVGVAIAIATALVAVAALRLAWNSDAGAVVEPDSLVKIDTQTNEIVDVVRIGRDPGQVAIVGKYVFVTSQRDQTLRRVDVASGDITVSGAFAAGAALAGTGRFLWVVSEKRAEVVQTDVESLLPGQRIPLRRGLSHAFIALGGGSLWVSQYPPGAVSRYRLRRSNWNGNCRSAYPTSPSRSRSSTPTAPRGSASSLRASSCGSTTSRG